MTDLDIAAHAIAQVRKAMRVLENINDEDTFEEFGSLYETLDDVQIDMTNVLNTLRDNHDRSKN